MGLLGQLQPLSTVQGFTSTGDMADITGMSSPRQTPPQLLTGQPVRTTELRHRETEETRVACWHTCERKLGCGRGMPALGDRSPP